MELFKMRVYITTIAMLTAIAFILLTYIFPHAKDVLLGIEVLLLPTIYIIGNECIESLIRREYTGIIDFISMRSEHLNEKYYKEVMENNKLKHKIEVLEHECKIWKKRASKFFEYK